VTVVWFALKAHSQSIHILTTTAPTKVTKPNPEAYNLLITEAKAKQKELGKAYKTANSKKKKEILSSAREYIESTMPKLMHCWIGTPWDFNGTSQTPGEGKIACGYFVSVVLRDMGFKVSRISLAQQPSQRIITTMIHSNEKKVIRYDLDYLTFIEQFKEMPDGIYIIGLDTHVGFLTNFDDEVHFNHSGASGVIDETTDQARDIKVSRYRVVGNVTSKDYVIEKWLLGKEFPTNK